MLRANKIRDLFCPNCINSWSKTFIYFFPQLVRLSPPASFAIEITHCKTKRNFIGKVQQKMLLKVLGVLECDNTLIKSQSMWKTCEMFCSAFKSSSFNIWSADSISSDDKQTNLETNLVLNPAVFFWQVLT